MSADELERQLPRVFSRNTPAVLTGLGLGPNPVRCLTWDLDSIARAAGNRRLSVMALDGDFASYERQSCTMTFNEFRTAALERAQASSDGGKLYLKTDARTFGDGALDPGLGPTLTRFARPLVASNLWVSAGRITVGLHFDAAENFNFQIAGTKTFTIYPPRIRGFYPDRFLSESGHVSLVSRAGADVDRSQFPRFPWGSGLSVTMRAGEALYLPAYWWHQVESSGELNINFNVWSLPSVRKQLRHPNQALRGYMGVALRKLRYGSIERTAQQ